MMNVTGNNFQTEVLNDSGLVLVDFWAPWCGPCRMVGPILDQIAQEQAGRVKVVKVNVDKNQELAAHYGVMSIPTMLIFKGGRLVDQLVGAYPKQTIEKRLAVAVAGDG